MGTFYTTAIETLTSEKKDFLCSKIRCSLSNPQVRLSQTHVLSPLSSSVALLTNLVDKDVV